MRKIINSAFVSLDGVTEDPRSWAIFDPDSAEDAVQALKAYDGMLMGRGTYEYFAEVMPKQTGPYADAINAIRKYVFSSTLETADWSNSTIIRDDVVGAVTELKRQDGRDLIMYGHGRHAAGLRDFADELRAAPVQPHHARGRDGPREGRNSTGVHYIDMNGGVYQAELWNPTTGTWKTLAAERSRASTT